MNTADKYNILDRKAV